LGSASVLHANSLPPTPGFFTPISINIPGASSIGATAISSSSNLAGIFSDNSGALHGFADNHGTVTTFDFPAGAEVSATTAVTGINDAGQVIGSYHLPDELFGHGFRYANGIVTEIPNYPYAINNDGTVVGWAHSCPIDFCGAAFIYSNGTMTTVNFPPQPPDEATDTRFLGINNVGDIVGDYRGGIPHHGFRDQGGLTYRGGGFTAFDVPGATFTIPSGINDAGQIVGTFGDSNGNGHGFLYDNGSFSGLDFSPRGIDSHGEILVGDSLFTPTPEPASLLLFGSDVIAICIAVKRRRRGFGR
jgi:probable HAF family extracellular repeat protein